ncbi:Isochorismatase hydrolase [Hyaloscypha variabilis F]|uniref:Isochorismatase hydrolase n=1 Tax=Hyaloscypha variabilis (strain UAMH 11265 / GT02V1 / F) TaxID=1149755 RepID=A0A2J6QUL1_HYAVF|nr:Isochorismatase hydrolase [Hyaloscypha variabilis F]
MSLRTLRSLVGVPPSAPSVNDSVLVIIDVQNEYIDGLLQITNPEPSRKVIHSLLEQYRTTSGDVIHVVHDAPEGAPVFTPNTHLAEIVDELKPLETEPIIHKRHASAFTGTTFQEELTKIGKTKIVLVGYMAHNCISATARAGTELGYDISVVRDGVGDREIPGATAEELVRVTLAELADVVATVINSTDLE